MGEGGYLLFQALFRLLCVSRLKNRVRFWFSCFILITCCFSFIPLYFIGKAHLEGEVILQLQQTTDLQYTFIEQWLEKRASNIRNLANLPLEKSTQKEKMIEAFHNFVRTHQEFHTVVFVNRQGIVEVDTLSTASIGTSVADAIYFQEAKQGNEYITDVFKGNVSSQPVIIFSSPVHNNNNEFQGVVSGVVKLTNIEKLMDTINFGHKGETYLVINKREAYSSLFSIALGMIGIIFLSIWISFYIALQLPRRLEEGEERFRLLAEHSSDMITIHDMNGVYQYVSPASTRLLGYHHEELIGKVPYDFMHPDDRKSTREKLINLLNTDYELTTFRIRAKDGHYVWFETTLKSIKDQEGKIQEVIAVSRNITDRKKMELELKQSNEHLQYLSSIDSVTGIANRRYFKENFEQEWKRAIQESTPISIILLDIDCFKAYNDTYGHQSGDHSLKQVSKTLESTLHGSHDLVARYGGEEFIIVLPDTDRNEAFIKAEELRSNVEALQIPHKTSPISHYVTISVGVSTMTPSFHQSADILIKEADKALYAAKSEGRNQVKAGDNL